MTATTEILTQDQINQLRYMYEIRLTQDQSIKGLWAPVYEQLYEYLTDLEASFGSGYAAWRRIPVPAANDDERMWAAA